MTWQDSRGLNSDIYLNIPFGARSYGTGKAGSEGIVPQLVAKGRPNLGSTITLTVTRASAGAMGVLAFGFGSETQASLPMLGGTLLVNPVSMWSSFVLGNAAEDSIEGSFSFEIRIPEQLRFLGSNLNIQAALLDPGATFGLSMTNGVEVWVL